MSKEQQAFQDAKERGVTGKQLKPYRQAMSYASAEAKKAAEHRNPEQTEPVMNEDIIKLTQENARLQNDLDNARANLYRNTEQPDQTLGDDLPAGMVKISKMIADFQDIMNKFGDTCVYIKPGVSWGATALWNQSDAKKAIEETAASFAATFKPEYKELAQQIMGHAISEGWVHQFAKPKREPVQPDKTSPSIACSDAFDLWAEGRPALRSASKRNEARYIWEQSWKLRPKRESGWLPIETLPDKLNNDIFVAYFISRGDCCWVQLKRTVEQIHKMMVQPTHWMYVPEVATTEIEGKS